MESQEPFSKSLTTWHRLTRAPLSRAFWLAFLVLVLQIPMALIHGVVSERQARRVEAVREVSAKWGGEQKLVGPLLEIPYEVDHTRTVGGELETVTETRHAFFLPQELKLEDTLDGELRHRGIFEVPLHTSELHLAGSFVAPDFDHLEETPSRISWDRARLTLYISDTKGIVEASGIQWDAEHLAFEPGTPSDAPGISVPVGQRAQRGASFSVSLRLRGSESIYFAPVGVNTTARLTSDWPHPSFQGAWLPTAHEISSRGFTAEYSVPHLGRDYPSQWSASNAGVTNNPNLGKASSLLFGVQLEPSIDHYRMAERSAKYSILFLVLTFGSLWLFEVLGKQRIHSLQYLLIGAAMCLFFLLELALSEHVGFTLAYGLASFMITSLVGGYCVAVLAQRRRAAIIAGVISSLYAGIYVLLGNEDFALLVGALGLFTALALLMFLTRKVDWYGASSGDVAPTSG